MGGAESEVVVGWVLVMCPRVVFTLRTFLKTSRLQPDDGPWQRLEPPNSGSPLHVPADSGHLAVKETIVRSVPWFTFIYAIARGYKRQQVNNCPGDESSQHSIRLTKALLQQSRDGAGTSRQGSRLEIGQGFRSFHPAPANLKRHPLPHKSVSQPRHHCNIYTHPP